MKYPCNPTLAETWRESILRQPTTASQDHLGARRTPAHFLVAKGSSPGTRKVSRRQRPHANQTRGLRLPWLTPWQNWPEVDGESGSIVLSKRSAFEQGQVVNDLFPPVH
eukprot:scaffold1237_cov403-Prasinococcus_capsulatus_cf.AAC.10